MATGKSMIQESKSQEGERSSHLYKESSIDHQRTFVQATRGEKPLCAANMRIGVIPLVF